MFFYESGKPGFWDFVYDQTDLSAETIILSLLFVFELDDDTAYQKTKELLTNKKVLIGTYTRDIAETFESKLLHFSRKEKVFINFKIVRHLEDSIDLVFTKK